ncbi:hypothetical protein [Streptomyces sp. H27-C3]|uniref:hypothetical protein n=1 Tax=Streptomyces sp. H27-C3 TaxID=3046305 RepID=UPI0024BB78BF|nr:hypothetical protein [Streptomyces sp. H27-C3]MDJ0461473.1 hypothetical protein [Streptomyces sp. H27-C3]
MAAANFSAALPAPAHPLAKTGYGKRSAHDQKPRGEADFVHLRPREAAVAAYIDRLPDGAAIGYKPLAANIADFGQQACGKALNFLSDAGHLRRVKEHLELEDSSFRWVTRTYFSRTARDDDWWKSFVGGLRGIDLTELERRAGGQEGAGQPAPQPAPAERSVAYRTLAHLGRTNPRMTLAAAECAALEGLAAGWLARGVTTDQLTHALTDGLPNPMHSPGAIARSRLEKKMPSEESTGSTGESAAPARIARAVIVCMGCDEPETVVTLTGGICAECREEMIAYDAAEEARVVVEAVPDTFRAAPAQVDVARRAAEARAAGGLKPRIIPRPTHGELAHWLAADVGEAKLLREAE